MLPVLKHIVINLILVASGLTVQGQVVRGKIIDAHTKEPVSGASLHCTDEGCSCGCVSNNSGVFEMKTSNCANVTVTCIGYETVTVPATTLSFLELNPVASLLNQVVITANRSDAVRRAQAPIAVSLLGAKTLADTRATSADQLLNKVSGVYMVNLGNEQHQMSIRQPMTTKSLFLYLEDGIPVRTTGLFNHNALLEMNMAAVRNIEVIKGPSSAQYGSEAIGGVVNFITARPTAIPVVRLSIQGNDIGYKRGDVQTSFVKGRWGFAVSGYYADKRRSFMEYTDFHKGTVTARTEYRISEQTQVSSAFTLVRYYSDMPGGVDSTMFATRTFSNPQTFTYRKVNALRNHTQLTHRWNDRSRSTVSLIYRDNSIGQNPNYRIRDDYRKTGNTWTGKKDLAHGEINESSFNSYAVIVQHREGFLWKNAQLSGGISADISPSGYEAQYIRIRKDTLTKKYTGFQNTDSVLTKYRTRINNYAAFAHFELSPVAKLRVVASLRYDVFHYDFNNLLPQSAFSGAPDAVNRFTHISPKIGFTYSFTSRTGVYANYSQGFVPPQVTEMYTGVKVPELRPATFYNYEAGGWAEVIRNRLSVDASLYRLNGSNEVISVRLDDGTSENRNAGKTTHKGIEFGINATPVRDITLRVSGAWSEHRFAEFVEKGNNYSGNQMNGAPRWMHNAEIWYKPRFARGARIGVEWQRIGSYFMDAKNTATYEGYHVFNLRAGYNVGSFDVWVNVLNAADRYYSYISTKSTAHSYQLGEPRNCTVGITYDFGKLFK